MKYCNSCGVELEDSAAFCSTCGAMQPSNAGQNGHTDSNIDDGTILLDESVQEEKSFSSNEQRGAQQNFVVQQQFGVQQGVYSNAQYQTYEEFYNAFASPKTRNLSKALGIISIITAVLSLIFAITISPIAFVDVAFYTALSVLLFIKHNWIVSLILIIYSGVGSLISIVLGSVPGGIVALVIGILLVINLKKLEEAYKVYQSTGNTPAELI